MERVWKRGDVGPDGRKFWGGSKWVSLEKFSELDVATKKRSAEYRAKTVEKRREYSKSLRVKIPGLLRERLREWRRKNPEKHRQQNLKAAAKQKLKGKAFWSAMRKTPEYKARYKSWRLRPENAVLIRIRARFKRSFSASFRGVLSSRSADFDAVEFLLWSAERRGIDPRKGYEWHIDHVKPASAFAAGEEGINAPENLRWVPALENLVKNARLPTPGEVEDARAHAQEWRNIFRKEKT